MTYTIYGALASPYSMKIRAVMRYRRLPHVWRQQKPGDEHVLTRVKAPVVPIVEYPDGTWRNDSTPLIFDLEARHPARGIVPDDPGLGFLAHLLEDMADEWGTKAMFYYRWSGPRDQRQMSEWIAFDRLPGGGLQEIGAEAARFRARQVDRMELVGCSAANGAVIEAFTHRVLAAFEQLALEGEYLFGSRPSLADFGWFGQLSQLAIDPTPQAFMRERYPFAYRWLANLEDGSGVEGAWAAAATDLEPAARRLLQLAGDLYLPFLAANAAAVDRGDASFEVELLGRPFRQAPFKYQARCLAALREAYAALASRAKADVDPVLDQTGCLPLLR